MALAVALLTGACMGSSDKEDAESKVEYIDGLPTWETYHEEFKWKTLVRKKNEKGEEIEDMEAREKRNANKRLNKKGHTLVPKAILVLHDDGTRCYKDYSSFAQSKIAGQRYRVSDCDVERCGTEVYCPDNAADVYSTWVAAEALKNKDTDVEDEMELPKARAPISAPKPAPKPATRSAPATTDHRPPTGSEL